MAQHFVVPFETGTIPNTNNPHLSTPEQEVLPVETERCTARMAISPYSGDSENPPAFLAKKDLNGVYEEGCATAVNNLPHGTKIESGHDRAS